MFAFRSGADGLIQNADRGIEWQQQKKADSRAMKGSMDMLALHGYNMTL